MKQTITKTVWQNVCFHKSLFLLKADDNLVKVKEQKRDRMPLIEKDVSEVNPTNSVHTYKS